MSVVYSRWTVRCVRSATARMCLQRRRPFRIRGQTRLCSHGDSRGAKDTPTLESNMQKLMFMVHPDLFQEDMAKMTNEKAVKTINSFVDDHRALLDSDEDIVHQPVPPLPIQLFVRPRTQQPPNGKDTHVTAVLRASSASDPNAFQKSLDNLFKLVGLSAVFQDSTGTVVQKFRKGSVAWAAQENRVKLVEAAHQRAKAENDVSLLLGALLHVHRVRVAFPKPAGHCNERPVPAPLALRSRVLWHFTQQVSVSALTLACASVCGKQF